LDESGSISNDRFFVVGCLKVPEPSDLLRAVQKLRDRAHWYQEIHFVDMTKKSLGFYKQVVDTIAGADAQYSCFVADRDTADPLFRFGTPWRAYEKLAEQLLIGSIHNRSRELITVLADNYSTPDDVFFEKDVRSAVNRRLRRLAIASVCRLDSRAADPLQLVDLLTSAVTFEFRQSAGLASEYSPKAQLAQYVRDAYGVDTFLNSYRGPKMNVQIYREGVAESQSAS
jgi:hypothetical protein